MTDFSSPKLTLSFLFFFPNGRCNKVLHHAPFYLVFFSFFWMCNFRIHWRAVWSVCGSLCLPSWGLQDGCCPPAGPAGFVGLLQHSPGTVELLSPAEAPVSAAHGLLLPAAAAHATLQSAEHNPTQMARLTKREGGTGFKNHLQTNRG